MRHSRRNVLASLALGIGILAVPQSAAIAADKTWTAESLPSSLVEMERTWRKMNPSTFTLSNASVLSQFDRVASYEPRFTSEKKERLAEMLVNDEGEEVWVPDGISFDYLTGRSHGKPFVYQKMRKGLDRVDRALLYDLGDGVYIYWFTGVKGVSCNNIAVVILSPSRVERTVVKKIQEYRWVMMPQDKLEIFRMQGFIPSLYIQACCNNPGGYCSGQFISGQVFGGGRVDIDPTMVRVRVPVQ